MIKVRILDKCPHCQGQAYLPAGQEVDFKGNPYVRHRPCQQCEGTGMVGRWVELTEFALLLDQAKCPHEHVSRTGSFHLSAGEVWDDVSPEICGDCGKVLE